VSSDGCTAVAKGDFGSAVFVDPDGGDLPAFVLCPWYGTGRHRHRVEVELFFLKYCRRHRPGCQQVEPIWQRTLRECNGTAVRITVAHGVQIF
jgi:hypothetical protein